MVTFLGHLGCEDPALSVVQASYNKDGWMIADTAETRKTVLKPTTGARNCLITRQQLTHYQQVLGSALPDRLSKHPETVKAMALRHGIAVAAIKAFPTTLSKQASKEQHKESMDAFYDGAVNTYPRMFIGASEEAKRISAFGRFGEGFGLILMQHRLTDVLGSAETADTLRRIRDQAAAHDHPRMRILGEALRPIIVHRMIAGYSEAYNQQQASAV